MGEIKGKTIAITGAGSGIGEAIARRFMADGATVVGSDVNMDGLAKLDGALTIRADVTKYEDVEAMVNFAVEKTGRLDVLINNAGIGFRANVADTDPAKFALLHAVHVNGCLHGMRAAIPVMTKQGGGHIINVVSRVAETREKGMSAYASAKAAMWSLTRIAAAEAEDDGVLINMMFPGMSRSGMTATGVLGDPSKLGAPDQQYDTFLHLATLAKGEPVGEVWMSKKVYPMFQAANDLGDLTSDLRSSEKK